MKNEVHKFRKIRSEGIPHLYGLYGIWKHDDRAASEQFVGRALREYAKRDDYVIATKFSHVDGAVKATDLELAADEIDYLEELYVPHALAGVMAQNGKQKAGNVV